MKKIIGLGMALVLLIVIVVALQAAKKVGEPVSPAMKVGDKPTTMLTIVARSYNGNWEPIKGATITLTGVKGTVKITKKTDAKGICKFNVGHGQYHVEKVSPSPKIESSSFWQTEQIDPRVVSFVDPNQVFLEEQWFILAYANITADKESKTSQIKGGAGKIIGVEKEKEEVFESPPSTMP